MIEIEQNARGEIGEVPQSKAARRADENSLPSNPRLKRDVIT